MKDIIIIAGSNNKNLEVAREFEKKLIEKNISCMVLDLISINLPLYTPTQEAIGIPKAIFEQIDLFDQAKGFIFVAPEYNGGVPPVVTNLIAWISRSGAADWRKSFNGKAAAIASFSGSGGFQALISLRTQLSYIGLNVIGRQVRATYKESLNHEDVDAVTSLLVKAI